MIEGRVNIHLRSYKEKLTQLHPGYGELTKIIRVLVESYVEGRLMHLSPEIAELLDQNRDEEAIELLATDLVALRQRRVSAAQKASSKRSRSKTQKAKDQAGIKTPEQQAADKMVEDMLKMQQDTTTIEFAGGEENGLEKPSGEGEGAAKPATGVARKVS